jgi:hypothetical protein
MADEALIPATGGPLESSRGQLEQVAQEWLRRQLSGVDVDSMFDPLVTGIRQADIDLAEALRGLIETIREGTAGVGEALMRLARTIRQGTPAGGSGGMGKVPAARQPASTAEIKSAVSSGIFKAILQNLALIVAPLSLLHTLLSQSTSGFQLFTGALNLVAASLAPILLPGFILVSGLLLALSAILADNIEPAFDAIATLLVGTVIPAVERVVDIFTQLYEAIRSFMQDIAELMPEGSKEPIKGGLVGGIWQPGAPDVVRDALNNPALMGGVRVAARDEANKVRVARGEAPLPRIGEVDKAGEQRRKNDANNFMKEFVRGIRDAANQFKWDTGSKASITGIVQASRAAQLAAMQSPYETRMLDIVGKVHKAVDKMVEMIDKQAVVGK